MEQIVDMNKNLIAALKRLYQTCGINVGSLNYSTVQVDPIEPLLLNPPEDWLYAVAVHLEDVYNSCITFTEDISDLTDADEAEFTDTIDGICFGGLIPELEFHTFYFPMYSYIIREKLLLCLPVGIAESLYPDLYEITIEQDEIDELTSKIVAYRISIKDRAHAISVDLLRLREICVRAAATIWDFSSINESDIRKIIHLYANVQAALMDLGTAQLRADVAVRRLTVPQL